MSLPTQLHSLLEALVRHRVEFVIVGGVAAVLEGAPIVTRDLDIVFETSPENVDRLFAVCVELEAQYRDPAGRQIGPDRQRLVVQKLHLLRTTHGSLDLLTEIGRQWTYDELVARSRWYELSTLRFRVLDLAAVIESKEIAGRDKDLAALPTLRSTLKLKRSLKTGS